MSIKALKISLIFLLIITSFEYLGAFVQNNRIINNEYSSITTGVLIDYQKYKPRGRTTKWSGIYEYTVDGEIYRYASTNHIVDKDKINSKAEIYYLESNPTMTATKMDAKDDLLSIFHIIAVIVFFIIL